MDYSYKDLELEDRRLAILYKITNIISGTYNLQDLLETLCYNLFDAFPAERCIIMIKEENSRRLRTYASRTFQGKEAKNVVPKSILREVYKNKKAVLCKDAMSDIRFLGETIIEMRIQSVMCVPLIYQDQMIGVIHLDSNNKSHVFSSEDLELLTGIALQTSSALVRLKLDIKRQEYIRNLEALARSTLKLSSLLNRDKIFRKTAIYMCNLLRCTKSSVVIVDGESLKIGHAVGMRREVEYKEELSFNSLVGWVIKHKEPILCRDVDDLPVGLRATHRPRYKKDPFLIVPILYTKENGDIQAIGALCATDRISEIAFDTDDQDMLSILACQTGIALANAELYERATIDSLTGVYVRRYLFQKLQDIIRKTRRGIIPVSMLMIDIDHFKLVNDTYGHPVGDTVLFELAKLVKINIRNQDIVARYGGEEFIVVLHETSLKTAVQIAERIRKAVEENVFNAFDKPIRLTISIGIGTLSKGETRRDFIEKADKALYRAKNEGRNRVCFFEDAS